MVAFLRIGLIEIEDHRKVILELHHEILKIKLANVCNILYKTFRE